MPLDNGLYCGRHFGAINNVETAQLRLPAFGYNGSLGFFRRRLLLHIVDQHQRIFVSKSLRNGAPNTARCASHECNLSLQTTAHTMTLFASARPEGSPKEAHGSAETIRL